jgi:hypothetical protein
MVVEIMVVLEVQEVLVDLVDFSIRVVEEHYLGELDAEAVMEEVAVGWNWWTCRNWRC